MCLPIALARPQHVLAHKEHVGFEYMVIHNGLCFRCGYVKVTQEHPWYGEDYESIACDVHGGLTFASFDEVCDKGGADDGYWVGFDCAHGGDLPDKELVSDNPFAIFNGNGSVRSQAYVEKECERLCEQAKEALETCQKIINQQIA